MGFRNLTREWHRIHHHHAYLPWVNDTRTAQQVQLHRTGHLTDQYIEQQIQKSISTFYQTEARLHSLETKSQRIFLQLRSSLGETQAIKILEQ